MASGFGVVMLLLGAIILVIATPTVANCVKATSNDPGCWSVIPNQNRYSSATSGFYVGIIMGVLGAMILVGPSLARFLGKVRDSGSNG